MRRIFPWSNNGDSIKALWQREMDEVDEYLVYLNGLTQTHVLTLQGHVEKSIVIAEAEADKLFIQGEIDKVS